MKNARMLPLWLAALFLFGGIVYSVNRGIASSHLQAMDGSSPLVTSFHDWMLDGRLQNGPDVPRLSYEALVDCEEYMEGTYEFEDTRVFVTMAFWEQGATETANIQQRVPEFWLQNEWSMEHSEDQFVLGDNLVYDLIPGQYRLMKNEDREQHVLFWHVVDGVPFRELSEVADTGQSGSQYVLQNANSNGEQVLIQLSSNKPYEQIVDEPDFKKLVSRINQFAQLEQSRYQLAQVEPTE